MERIRTEIQKREKERKEDVNMYVENVTRAVTVICCLFLLSCTTKKEINQVEHVTLKETVDQSLAGKCKTTVTALDSTGNKLKLFYISMNDISMNGISQVVANEESKVEFFTAPGKIHLEIVGMAFENRKFRVKAKPNLHYNIVFYLSPKEPLNRTNPLCFWR